MRLIGCWESDAFLGVGTALPRVQDRFGYRAFQVDQPDGTQILAYCENAYGRSETVPIVLPEVSGLLPAMLLLVLLWRIKRWHAHTSRQSQSAPDS